MSASRQSDGPAATRAGAYLALAAATLGWSTSPIFIRYLSDAYDPYSQAFLRYAFGLIPLLAYCLYRYPADFRRALSRPRAMGGLALVNIVNQAAWTVAIFHPDASATQAQLITKLQVPSTIIFAFFLFREERAIIRSPRFQLGTLLGLLGAAGVMVKEPGVSLLPTLDLPTMMFVYVAVGWGVYAVWGKHSVRDVHPVAMFTMLSIYTTAGFAALSLMLGRPSTLVHAGWGITAIAAVSGIFPIAVAHSSYHYAQKHIGAVFCGSLLLLSPLLTNLIALTLWDDEKLTAVQWAGAAVLLLGSFLVILAERSRGPAREAHPEV